MPIYSNEGGVLYELDNVYSNDGGTLYELDTVHSNNGGVLNVIHSAWSFPVLGDWTTPTSYVTTSTLNGDTYSVDCYSSAAADFTLTGKTKVTITLTSYDSGTIYSCAAQIREGFFRDSNLFYTSGSGAFAQRIRTGQSSYTSSENLTAEYVLEKGNYYVGCGNNVDGRNGRIKFTVKFEKA